IPLYIGRICHIAFLLEEARVAVTEEDLILTVTAGLPTSYDRFLIGLDNMPDDDFCLDIITTRLANEYQRQNNRQADSAPTPLATQISDPAQSSDLAFAAASPSRLDRITCYGCGKKGHYQSNCP
ncbi:hypothetical protein CPB83DRAFT_747155, partial [Crepidotus variabilis]